MALPPVLDEENLYKFRTKICERYVKQGKCEFADKCQYSHDLRWTRRPPWKYTYAPELCRDLVFVTDGRGRTIAKSNCKQKRNCRFAHTKEEQMYHPKVYKTAMCHQFKENGWCDRYYCPFAHFETELRPTEQSDDIRKSFSKPAVQEALCPDIYLPSDRPHPRLRARFLAIMDGIPSQNHLHLALDPGYLSNAGGARTRQPYTDFISSHTPHSVLSESSPPAQAYGQQKGTASSSNTLDGVSRNIAGSGMVNRTTKSSTSQLPPRQNVSNKENLGERRTQRTTSRLVQLLQAKQYAGNNSGDAAAPKPITSSGSVQTETYHYTAHVDGPRMAAVSVLAAGSDVPPYGSAYASTHSAASAQQWTSMPGSPLGSRTQVLQTEIPRAEGYSGTQNTIFDNSFAAPLLPALVQQGERRPNAKVTTSAIGIPGSGVPFEIDPHPTGGLSAILARADGWFAFQQTKAHIDTPHSGALPSCSTWGNVDNHPGGPGEVTAVKTATTNEFRVKCLSSDICYWNQPIGRSRDDPSVLVYAGLLLGPGKTREVVAVKQLPVVVLNRAGALWREVQRFLTISDPQLVNIKRALFLPGESDEGTSLWVITEKCQGSIVDIFPLGTVSPSFLQATFPPTGLNGLLHYLLRAIQTLHYQSQGAHMRIHPGNVMIGCHGEVKLGDCAGKIRYLSILDLLHAGIQGASNAKALLQWILGTPQETCWMAPEFLTSLLDLEEELSQAMRQWGNDKNKNEQAFAAVARNFKWPVDFLRKADAWAAGATLFYIASGGLHPYGSANDSLILANILADKKLNFDKLSNCPWLADLLSGLLCHNPAQRLSITQALHHPLFWTSEDIEKYLEDLRTALEQSRIEESMRLQDVLSYSINWVESLQYIPSPVPLLPLLLSYMAMPSASPQLLAAHPHQSALSFLVFLAYIAEDKRIALVERRLIVSECLMAHAAPFLHSVYLFLFPKFTTDREAFTNSLRRIDCNPSQSYGWHLLAGPSTEGSTHLTASPQGVHSSLSASTRPGIPFSARTFGVPTYPNSPHNIFREGNSDCPNDNAGNTRPVPPPPSGPGATGMLSREAMKPAWGEATPGIPGRQRRYFRYPQSGLVLHAGTITEQEAGGVRPRASTAGTTGTTDSKAEVAPHRAAALTERPMALQMQALIKEAASLRPQTRQSGLRGAREAGNTDRISRLAGSPSGITRPAKEVAKKGNKIDTKQRGSGSAKELRWPCGAERLGGPKQQSEPRHPPGMGKATGLWGPSTGPVDGQPDPCAMTPLPADAGRGQQGAVLHTAEAKGEPGVSSCGDAPVSPNGPSGRTLETSQTLQPCSGIPAKSARHLHGGIAAPLKAYEEEAPGLRKGLVGAHTEIKFSFGSSSTLLQMPVAVSTVSTALSSATASEFCHGQSQPTDGVGEIGAWRHEPPPSSVEGVMKEAAKPQEAKGPERQEGAGIPRDIKAPDTAIAEHTVTGEGISQSTRYRENLRRDTSNACTIQ